MPHSSVLRAPDPRASSEVNGERHPSLVELGARLRSIRAHLHTDDYVRVRIGVGKPPSKEQGADHVLKRPGKATRAVLDAMIERAADAVEVILDEGAEVAMDRFNGLPDVGVDPT